MARKFTELAKEARRRLSPYDEETIMALDNPQSVAPPKAKKAKYLRDADGNLYLWTESLAERGDLVAAFDPENPDEFIADQEQIELNRKLEIAQEEARLQEAARLESEKAAKLAEEKALDEAKKNEELIRRNRELEAKLAALEAKETVGETTEEAPKPRAAKKKTPVKKEEVVAEEAEVVDTDGTIDLSELDD